MAKRDLDTAKDNKKDEFYTSLTDIELEMKNYKDKFFGKTVLCNCDDPFESNFFKYFAMNFKYLGLKKLICTCYDGSPVAGTEFNLFTCNSFIQTPKAVAVKVVITDIEDYNHDGAIDMNDVETLLKSPGIVQKLNGNGDFRSDECIELLKESDIVCTNPPFSLFREFISTLFAYNKQFIIIGNVNAIAYKEVYPYIINNKLWMGQSIHSGDREFRVPNDYPLKASGWRIDDEGNKYIRVKGVRWWSNIDYPKRHEDMTLYRTYKPELYPKYDNCDAINIDVTSEIPSDYYGLMGVPITFLDKYNPSQFELVRFRKGDDGKDLCVKGKCPYFRILIRRK